jgi:hypothetical protein
VLSIKALFDAGLIKHWGVSNENAYGITMFCVTCDKLGVPRPVSCQNDFSLCDRMYENDTAEAAYRFGVVGLPYGTLAGAWPRPPPTHTHGPALAWAQCGAARGQSCAWRWVSCKPQVMVPPHSCQASSGGRFSGGTRGYVTTHHATRHSGEWLPNSFIAQVESPAAPSRVPGCRTEDNPTCNDPTPPGQHYIQGSSARADVSRLGTHVCGGRTSETIMSVVPNLTSLSFSLRTTCSAMLPLRA